MADLERELAHAETMATAVHTPECRAPNPSLAFTAPPFLHPDPDCAGCVSDADRALWRQLAGEYRAQLDRHRQETLL